jgi:pyruvate,water dikinase
MGNSYLFLKKFLSRKKKVNVEESARVFRNKYSSFKELLASNAELLKIVADIEVKLQGRDIFGMAYIRSQTTRAMFHAIRMVKAFEGLAGKPFPALEERLEAFRGQIGNVLDVRRETKVEAYVLPYTSITRDMVDVVGGKSANLGEVLNKVKLPIPRGFAITTKAYDDFVRQGDMAEEIEKAKLGVDANDPEGIVRISEDIQALFLRAEVPAPIATAILGAYDLLREEVDPHGPGPNVSMRSSAIGEDSELSFAGQYLSVLNVPREQMLRNYKMIIASLFTPRAISYRLQKGVPVDDIAMSVACLEMVRSVSSGVMYTRHPFDILDDSIIVNAVWGLGAYAVDGVVPPDEYAFSKTSPPRMIRKRISRKPVRLGFGERGYVREEQVPESEQEAPCLSDEQAAQIAAFGLQLEKHYHTMQDVEWAIGQGGELRVLQTRPLRVEDCRREKTPPRVFDGHPLLVEKGDVASPGVGCGPVHLVENEDDLSSFPEGGVLVARHSSPKFMLVLPKAQAVVTDSGSVTGHMASLVREFKTPSLLNVGDATSRLRQGEIVTVDCFSGLVYAGKIEELLEKRVEEGAFMRDTPIYHILEQIGDLIVPLNLVDPKSPHFAPKNCTTIHDLMRYLHEKSYGEMFKISDMTSESSFAVKLGVKLPIDLYVIDVGGGLEDVDLSRGKIEMRQVLSIPFLALLKGMTNEGVRFTEPRPVHLTGLFSVMSQQMLQPERGAERFGEKSYAIVSDKYLNFSSRVGYHYSVLDAYCGQTVSKNYVTFEFKGGAADEVRRGRRVRSIALILERLGFTVDVQNDRVTSRKQKEPPEVIQEALDQLGRLLIYTRQMDMLMTTEKSVERMAVCFLSGDYSLCMREGS